jgi:hypothetical protein
VERGAKQPTAYRLLHTFHLTTDHWPLCTIVHVSQSSRAMALFPEKSKKTSPKSLCSKRLSAIFLIFDFAPSSGKIRFLSLKITSFSRRKHGFRKIRSGMYASESEKSIAFSGNSKKGAWGVGRGVRGKAAFAVVPGQVTRGFYSERFKKHWPYS